jgi:hypothetical protein
MGKYLGEPPIKSIRKKMKSDSLSWISAIYFVALIMLLSTSCSVEVTTDVIPTIVPTSTPERLRLIGGEINPCLLINSGEVRTVLGVEVTNQAMLLDYMPSCKYISTTNDQSVLLIVSATTDVSIKKANQPWLKDGNQPISAMEAYERQKMAVLKLSEIYKFEDLDNLGDQAFLYRSTFLVVNVLKNKVFYQFNGAIGLDQDTVMKLIRIGLERMP